MQNDTSIENVRAMTDAVHDFGGYSSSSRSSSSLPPAQTPASVSERQGLQGMCGQPAPRIAPGVCFPWENKVRELPEITGDPALIRKVWEDIDGLANTYIWQLLLSF
jgi:hypothetical protein